MDSEKISPMLRLIIFLICVFAASCVVRPAHTAVVIKPRPKKVVVVKKPVIVKHAGWRRHCR